MSVLALACALMIGEPADWKTDAQGKSFRVGFDPGSRVILGAGWSWQDESRLGLETGILVRATSEDEGVRWKLAHAFLLARADLGSEDALRATLYRGEYLRWAEDGAITIPTAPPSKLPFPLDIGFAVELGRFTRRFAGTARSTVGIVGAEILFDAWRSPRVGSYLVLGVGPSWDLVTEPEVRHVVAPFSAARLTLHHEWAQGKLLFEATIGAATRWVSDGPWADRAHADIAWEWTLLALNDNPLALRLAARWSADELALASERGFAFEAGLRLGL